MYFIHTGEFLPGTVDLILVSWRSSRFIFFEAFKIIMTHLPVGQEANQNVDKFYSVY